MIQYKTPRLEPGFHSFEAEPSKEDFYSFCGGLDSIPTVSDEEFLDEFVHFFRSRVTVPAGYDSPYQFGFKLRQLVNDDLAEIIEFNGCYICIAESGKTAIYNPDTLLRKG